MVDARKNTSLTSGVVSTLTRCVRGAMSNDVNKKLLANQQYKKKKFIDVVNDGITEAVHLRSTTARLWSRSSCWTSIAW